MSKSAKSGFRQGDVWIVPINNSDGDSLIKERNKIALVDNEIILAGKAGNPHSIPGKHASLFGEDDESIRYLKVSKSTSVSHANREKISLKKGYYRIVRQRIHTPQ